jgi:hypothetical protein
MQDAVTFTLYSIQCKYIIAVYAIFPDLFEHPFYDIVLQLGL